MVHEDVSSALIIQKNTLLLLKYSLFPPEKKISRSHCELIQAEVGAMFSEKCELFCAAVLMFIWWEFGNFGDPKPQTMKSFGLKFVEYNLYSIKANFIYET